MSKAKHTPGPWEVGVYNTTDRFRNTTQHTCVFKPDSMGLLAVTGPYGDEQSKIDARLIAAAPELLELLSEARQAIDWYLGLCGGFEAGETYGNHPDPDAYSYLKNEAINIGVRIDAAIAAATGEVSP